MSSPGWFPDPAGVPGRFRYWDGNAWSPTTTTDPSAPPPGAGGPVPGGPGGGNFAAGSGGGGNRKTAFIVIGIVVALALIVGLIWGITRIANPGESGPLSPNDPAPTPTQQICPQDDTPPSERADPVADGRVHGGQLSYPQLGSPWSAPFPENRIAFGRDAVGQQVPIESDPSWVAGVFVADLIAGDGFFGPEKGSEVVLDCITGEFYGDTEVTRDDQRSEALTVDGHDAWIIETWLGFDIPGLEAKREYVIVVIVETEPGAAAVYFASIPENAPEELLATAKELVGQLKVG